MHPVAFAQKAAAVAEEEGFRITVLDEEALVQRGLFMHVAVGQVFRGEG